MSRSCLLWLEDCEAASGLAATIARLACRRGCEVLVAVAEPDTGSSARLKPFIGSGVRTRTLTLSSDHAADQIVRTIEEAGCELVAMALKRRSGLSSLWLGDLGSQVAGRVRCPVLIARDGRKGGTRPFVLGQDDVILLPVDTWATAQAAVATLMDLVESPAAGVLVLHVCEAVSGGEAVAYVEPEEEGWQVVRPLVSRLARSGFRVEGMIVEASFDVAAEIATIAEERSASLIVMGSKPHSSFAGRFLRSTDHQVMRLTDRPVLLARQLAVPVLQGGSW